MSAERQRGVRLGYFELLAGPVVRRRLRRPPVRSVEHQGACGLDTLDFGLNVKLNHIIG